MAFFLSLHVMIIVMSIAEQLSMLNSDEALEITPKSCRLRKTILNPHERKKSEKSGAAA